MPHCPTKRQSRKMGRGFHLPHMWQYCLRDYLMLNTNKLALGTGTRSRTALAFVAATLLVGGSVTEASAKSRHHRHHHQQAASEGSSWREANASIASSSSSHSFSGMASFYGNESGSKNA